MELIKNYLWTETTDEIDNKKLFDACLELEVLLRKQFKGPPIGEKDQQLFTTSNFDKYNIFTYPNVEIQKLYHLVVSRVKKYLDTDTTYVLQSWLNVYRKGAFIGWHGHWPTPAKVWHGYYCVNTEGSITSYKVNKEQYDVINHDGLLIVGRSGEDSHQSSAWDQDVPRITIGYDIIPVESINQRKINHYIPIL